MKLGHVAVFTKDVEKSLAFYALFGGKLSMRDTLDLGGGRSKELVHVSFDGEATLELVYPSHEDMMLTGAGVCEHFCFNVENVDAFIQKLKANGIDTFQEGHPFNADIFGSVRVAFLTGPNGELIELLQEHQ